MNPKTTYYYPKMFVVKIFALGLAVGIILTVALAVTHRSTASAVAVVQTNDVHDVKSQNELSKKLCREDQVVELQKQVDELTAANQEWQKHERLVEDLKLAAVTGSQTKEIQQYIALLEQKVKEGKRAVEYLSQDLAEAQKVINSKFPDAVMKDDGAPEE